MEFADFYQSPLGQMQMCSDGKALTVLRFYDGSTLGLKSLERPDVFDVTRQWLDCYFSGTIPWFTPEICLNGTEFQHIVWEELLKIPYGQTETYGNIARKAGLSCGLEHMSAQAVGRAAGQNPIAVIIPCHRVVGSDGRLTGYFGGIKKKKALLELERKTASCSAWRPGLAI